MRKTIATLTAFAALVVAPSAHALYGDNYGAAPINSHPEAIDAATAYPGEFATWAGPCDRLGAPAPGSGIDLSTVDPTGFGEIPAEIMVPTSELINTFVGGLNVPALVPAPAPPFPDHCIDYGATAPYDWMNNLWQENPWTSEVFGPAFKVGQETPVGDFAPAWRLPELTRAGAHPDGTNSLYWNRNQDPAATKIGKPDGSADNVYVDLPAGFAGDPNATPKCTAEQFAQRPIQCPPSTQVGILRLSVEGVCFAAVPCTHGTALEITHPVYNLVPREGYAAEFGMGYVGTETTVRIGAKLRTNDDFGITAFAGQIPAALVPISQVITLWGVPWAPQNDHLRAPTNIAVGNSGCNFQQNTPTYAVNMIPLSGLIPSCRESYDPGNPEYQDAQGNPLPVRPFISNGTACTGATVTTTLRTDAYQRPGAFTAEGDPDKTDPDWKTYSYPVSPSSDCDQVGFDPDMTLDPITQGGSLNQAADSPAGLNVELTIPQNNDLPFPPPAGGAPQAEIDQYLSDATVHWRSPAGLATSHLKDSVVTLPPGMTINPASADGQGTCSMAQMGVTDINSPVAPRIRFNKQPVTCPDSSKLGTVVVETPVLDEADWPRGSVYLAEQARNPFGSDFAIYLAMPSPDRDILIKVAGKVEPDPATGRLTTVFPENPQQPFEKFKLIFRGGPRAALATPGTCGTHTNVSALAPYSDPGSPAVVNDPFQINSSPAGGCPATPAARPLNLGFTAGSTQLVAGSASPFTVRLTRGDGNQEIDRIEVTTPEGLAAKLAGVPYCPEAGIARAIARTANGDGALERANPSCPAASQVGTTTVGAGAGPNPFYVKGNAYLAGPYKGAPVSLAFIVPAVAGPFDLGVQVVRTALNVNPRTAQVTAVSDGLPQILRGVPLRIRDVRVDIDRPGFTVNPTDCTEQLVSGKVFGISGAVTEVSNRFQIAECARLPFRPKLALTLIGKNGRASYQGVKAVLTTRPGDANMASASVTLPKSAFLAQEHIRTVCTRVQFAADNCPKGAIYGKATAITPLLDNPLTGNVYLRSSDNELPDLVPDLRGPAHQPIKIEVAGRTDSAKSGAMRNTFDLVPDAPVSKFTLALFGGKKALVVNSENLCAKVQRATVKLTAQNGRTYNFRPVVRTGCKKKQGRKGKGKAARAAGHRRG